MCPERIHIRNVEGSPTRSGVNDIEVVAAFRNAALVYQQTLT
jgi:hypothetical protein